MLQRLTKTLVDSLPITGKLYEKRDAEVIGFSVRVTPAGVKSYAFQWRDKLGKWRREGIGRHGTITCDKARQIAKDWAGIVASGGTPNSTSESDIAAQTTIEQLRDRYMNEHAIHQKPRTRLNNQGYWDNHIIPAFKGRLVSEITAPDAKSLHIAMRPTPTNANRVIECLRKAMNLAEAWKMRPEGSNPARGIKPYRLKKRKRYMTPDEAKAFGVALREFDREGGLTARYAALVRLEIYTGARKGEFLNALWTDIDWDRCILNLIDTKSNESQELILPLIAIDVLKGLERVQGNPYIIAGGKAGKPLQETRRLWARLCKMAGVKAGRVGGIVMHDLRHSFASYTISATGNLAMVGGLLRHADPQTTARYAHLLDDPLRAASDMGAGHLASLVDNAPLPDNVIPMIKRAK